MCIQEHHHFTKCNHITSTIKTCPSYHKQQSWARSWLGCCLCYGGSRKKKRNCGKVVPHHLRNDAYCHDCATRTARVFAQRLGHGPVTVRQEGVEESLRADRKKAARSALEKSEKSRQGRRMPKYDVVHVQSSVWPSDSQETPEFLESKVRQAASASSRPPKHAGTTVSSRSGRAKDPRSRDSKKYGTGRRSRSVEMLSIHGDSPPMRELAQPAPVHHHDRHFADRAPSRAPPPPPPPPKSSYGQNPRSQKDQPSPNDPKHRELRHKTGRVYNSNKSRNPPRKPEYQEYLDAMRADAARQVARQAELTAERAARAQHTASTRDHSRSSERKERRPPKAGWIDRAKEKVKISDADSDVSFACQDALAISGKSRSKNSGSRRPRK
ncbi:hypothetical protein GGS20DRAFT_585240 [Poronia punctata]|nr:hypothetical protein GGS20DRAFT_585240 [Poronia punctata]